MDIYGSYTETVGRFRTVVAIGNFDGLHRGHTALLRAAQNVATRNGCAWSLLTFSPHPAQVLAPDRAPPALMSTAEKTHAFQRLGLQKVWFQKFSRAFAELTPEAFVEEVLIKGLGVSHVVVGFDFCFGRHRSGNVQVLEQLLSTKGISLTVVEAISDDLGKVSSSVIRKALSEGRVEDANELLRWTFAIHGRVLHGDARGRTIGFPTMNLELKDRLQPLPGVYGGWIEYEGAYYPSVANLGAQPTVGDARPSRLEVHALNVDLGSMYGREIVFFFDCRIREIRRFSDLAALQDQIEKDAAEVITRLGNRVPSMVSIS